MNTAVRDQAGISCTSPLAAPGPDGSTYICWFEQEGGPYVLRMQRLGVDGAPLWDPAGVVVSNEPQNSAIYRYDLVTDAAGHAVVAFQDERSGILDVAASRIGPDGTPHWGNDGLPLPTPGTTGIAPAIGALTDGRMAFAWNTARTPATVAWRVLAADGTPDPLGTQELAANGTLSRPRIIPTSDGGFWLQYVEQSGNFLSPGTLKAKRFQADLSGASPITVCTATISGFYFPQPVPDGLNGFYVAINTANSGNANLTDVHVTRLRGNGTVWSTTGTAVEGGTSTQRYTMTGTPALVGDVEGVMMVYRRTDIGQSSGGIAVQRFDTAGIRQLGPQGVEVLPLSAALHAPFGNRPVPGGIVCAQLEGGTGSNTLSAFRIGLDGSVVDPPGELPVSSVVSGKDDPVLLHFRDGQGVAVWYDERNGYGIFAQNMLVDEASMVPPRPEGDIRVIQAPQPVLLLPRGLAPGLLRIHGADGRLVHTQRMAAATAGTRIALPVHLLGSGVYVADITTAEATQAVRFVVE